MVSRCVLLAMLFAAKGVLWFLENPRASLLEAHPRMQFLIAKRLIFRVSLRLGDFGAACEKHTWIYSSHPCIVDLPNYKSRKFHPKKHKTVETRIIRLTGDGKIGVWGSPSLKGTQEYPIGFGRAVIRLFRDNRRRLRHDLKKLRAKVCKANVSIDSLLVAASGEQDEWPDAGLAAVLGEL
jgi:hypothetical protein